MPSTQYLVTKAWERHYPDPIAVRAGDPLVLDGRADNWDGHRWLWAQNAAGKEGWVPDAIVSGDEPWFATQDYSAIELTVKPGQQLSGFMTMHGWAWCQDEDLARGWVPLSHLKEV